jgi:hypothetical protein
MPKRTTPDSIFLDNQTYGVETTDDGRSDEEWIAYAERWMAGEKIVLAEPIGIFRKDGKVRIRVVGHWAGVNA